MTAWIKARERGSEQHNNNNNNNDLFRPKDTLKTE